MAGEVSGPRADGIRRFSPAEAAHAAAALAAAFQDDPVMGWCFPRPGHRAAALRTGFELFLRRVWLEHDQCFTTDGVAGAACWLPPGHWHLPALRQLSLLPSLLRPGDVLVFNDARVVPARFMLQKASGGRVEGLFLGEDAG